MKPITTYLKNLGTFLISFIVFIEIGCLFCIRYINQSIRMPSYRVIDANNNFWTNLPSKFLYFPFRCHVRRSLFGPITLLFPKNFPFPPYIDIYNQPITQTAMPFHHHKQRI